MSMVRRLRAVAALALLAACANPMADQALYAQGALIGMPKTTLLSCAGVPARQTAVDNREFYTYSSGRIVSYPTPSFGFYGGGWGAHHGYGGGYWPGYGGSDVASIDCEATFSLRNGVVERIVYGGATGGSSGLGQCYAIVQNCLALVPPKPAQMTP